MGRGSYDAVTGWYDLRTLLNINNVGTFINESFGISDPRLKHLKSVTGTAFEASVDHVWGLLTGFPVGPGAAITKGLLWGLGKITVSFDHIVNDPPNTVQYQHRAELPKTMETHREEMIEIFGIETVRE